MLVKIKVITKSTQNKIGEKLGDYTKIYVTAAPEKGKANKMVIGLIAKWFKVSKSNVKIVSGKSSELKTIKIENS